MPGKEIIIRKAEPGDEGQMAELEKICFAVPWTEEDFRRELTENRLAFYIVAEVTEERKAAEEKSNLSGKASDESIESDENISCCGRIAGAAGVWKVIDEGHITNVSVHPDIRGRGIASKIIEKLINDAEAQGIDKFTLEVRKSNEAALALYRKYGFKEAGIRRKYYSDNGEDAIIMWRM